jgi:purine-nucleoside phosphorylase
MTEAWVVMGRLRKAVAFVRTRTEMVPRVAIVSGPGLEPAGDAIALEARVLIPGMDRLAELCLGRMDGVPVAHLACAADRRRGPSVRERGFPIRVLGLLGAELLLLTGACLALDPRMNLGDLVIVDDHLNLLGDNPLIGPNMDDLGPRFPDMSELYDRSVQAMAREAARAADIPLARGVYAAVPDANLRTSAEYSILGRLGADLVGMDVVGEAIVARHMGMRVIGLLVVVDRGPKGGSTHYPPDLAEPRITRVIRGLMAEFA